MRTLIVAIAFSLGITIYNSSDGIKDIELKGDLEHVLNKSLSLPFKAWLDDNAIFIECYEATNEVTITIMGLTGEIEKRTLSFTDSQIEQFDTSEYPQGMYTITLVMENESSLYGTFSIE